VPVGPGKVAPGGLWQPWVGSEASTNGVTYTTLINSLSTATFGTGTAATAAFTPPAGTQLLAITGGQEDNGVSDPSGDFTVSDSQGLTWTRVGAVGNASNWSHGLVAWISTPAAATSMTVSFDCGTRNIYRYFYGVIALGGASGTAAGTVTNATSTTNGAYTVTLTATPDVAGLTVFARLLDTAVTTLSMGSGWSVVVDQGDSSARGALAIAVRPSSNSTTVSIADTNVADTTTAKASDLAFILTEAGGGVSATAGVATGTGSANAATTNVGTVGAAAAGAGAVGQPAANVGTAAAAAAGTGAALQPTVTVASNAAVAAGTGTAQQPSITAAAPAGNASGAGAAYNPTVSAAATTNAAAGNAAGTGAANGATVASNAAAGLATGAGAAQASTPRISAPTGSAAGTGAPGAPIPNVGPAAGTGTGIGAANTPTPKVATGAGNAAGTGTAQQPTVNVTGSTNAAAGTATGTGAALSPTVSVPGATSAGAAQATGAGTANPATARIGLTAARATGVGAA
jgi:hypothetical protein